MDANFLAPRGNVYGGYALGGVAEFGGIYGGRGTAEGAKKAREAKALKHGTHPHAHKKVPELKAEAKVVADQREAINRQIEAASSPEALAAKAQSLGMRPSNSLVFLNLDAAEQALANGEIKRG